MRKTAIGLLAEIIDDARLAGTPISVDEALRLASERSPRAAMELRAMRFGGNERRLAA